MKVAFLYYHFIQFGGVERVLLHKINLLANLPGYDVTLITYNQGNHPFVFPLSPKVKHVDLNTRYFSRCSYHGLYQFVDRWISKRHFLKTVADYLENLQPDVITCMDSRISDIEAIAKADIKGKKIIECHTGKQADIKECRYLPFFKRFIKRSMLNYKWYMMSKLDVAVCLTERDADSIKDKVKTKVIPNVLISYPEKSVDYNIEKKKIISAGRLHTQKGFDLLQDAWKLVIKKHPDWHLDIYGNYDVREPHLLKQEIKGLTFYPAVNNIYAKYMESDFYVLSSRWESFGLVLIEAMSCGIPCVAFDCPHGPAAIIKDKEDGLLATYMDIKDLADKMCWMIEHPAEHKEMGRKARLNAKRFLPDNVMKIWNEFYCSLNN